MYDARIRADLADALAAAYLEGEWEPEALLARSRTALAPQRQWLRGVAREVAAAYPRAPLDRPRELARFVELSLARRQSSLGPPRVVRRALPVLAMGRRRWPVPELAAVGDLAAWLELEPGALAWFADVRSLERRAEHEPLRHYRYAFLQRPGGRPRVIEQPKTRLKAIQRRLLHEILMWIPAHDAAHGFVPGRSARTHAAAHVGRQVVIRLDLEDCFASVRGGRVYGIFRTAGYPESVAHVLTGLCTNAVPIDEWDAVPRPSEPRLIAGHHRLARRLAIPHLPQGAPTSPALANLCAHRLDRRLSGLAAAFGARYTRYADDLVLSGDALLHRRAAAVRAAAGAIAHEEGFRVNDDKSQLMTRAGRQRVCGIVVNDRVNLARVEYDRLKAIVHDAIRNGPAAANRAGVPDFRAHLRGRIAWLSSLHPQRGARLRERFERIAWE
jgi:RNA-directed DNA polymerase